MRLGEQRFQQCLVQRQRQRKCVQPGARTQRRLAAAAPPEQQRCQQQDVHVQIDDEPQVVPAEITGGVELEPEHALEQERKVAAVPLAAHHALDEDLRGHDHEHAEDHRHQEPQRAFADQRGAAAPSQRVPHCSARDHEQQGHAQAVRDVHRQLQRWNRLGVRDVPPPTDEQHAGVEEHQHEDGNDAQPVEEVVALGGRGRRHGALPRECFTTVGMNARKRDAAGASGDVMGSTEIRARRVKRPCERTARP